MATFLLETIPNVVFKSCFYQGLYTKTTSDKDALLGIALKCPLLSKNILNKRPVVAILITKYLTGLFTGGDILHTVIKGALKSPPHRCTKSGNNFTGMSRHYPREIGVLSFQPDCYSNSFCWH